MLPVNAAMLRTLAEFRLVLCLFYFQNQSLFFLAVLPLSKSTVWGSGAYLRQASISPLDSCWTCSVFISTIYFLTLNLL